MVALVGLVVTLTVAWTAWHIDRSTERRLLQVQTRQAANVLALAIVNLQSPLQTVVAVAAATDGNASDFTRFMSGYSGPAGLFVGSSLWQMHAGTPTLVASTGDLLTPPQGAVRVISRASRIKTFAVSTIAVGGQQRIGYALSDPARGYAVYAERVIPADREVSVESDSAFSDLHFATYLGSTTSTAALQTTDQPLSRLPMRGNIARATIPFGDTTITLVTSPVGHLGGSVGSRLPWFLLGGGILLSAVAALTIGQLVRRRQEAERNASTITELYDQLDGLFAEQRSIAETLQHALLPQSNPAIPGLEFATRYLAGAEGVDVGGDWYSIIQLDGDHFGFVVGDISGRGVQAAALMARVRFTLRAYLLEGHPPGHALALASRQLDVDEDGHFATVLVGQADLITRQVTLANAGHLNPLILSGGESYFVNTITGPRLGVLKPGVSLPSYPSVTIDMSPGSTLIAFTDGLVERRNEDLDTGLQRLADAATAAQTKPPSDMLSDLLSAMAHPSGDDDTALLAFTWTPRLIQTALPDLTAISRA